jgi:hypothetical protein
MMYCESCAARLEAKAALVEELATALRALMIDAVVEEELESQAALVGELVTALNASPPKPPFDLGQTGRASVDWIVSYHQWFNGSRQAAIAKAEALGVKL